jgi:hypothetical protein
MGVQGTTESFIKKALYKHGDKYDYSLVEYKNSKNKIIIICKTHGPFNQLPNNHLNGNGCNECAKENNIIKRNYNNNIFIKKAIKKHNDKFDYSLVNYIKSYIKVIIICKLHGKFEQSPKNHLSGHGCILCNKLHNKYKN